MVIISCLSKEGQTAVSSPGAVHTALLYCNFANTDSLDYSLRCRLVCVVVRKRVCDQVSLFFWCGTILLYFPVICIDYV